MRGRRRPSEAMGIRSPCTACSSWNSQFTCHIYSVRSLRSPFPAVDQFLRMFLTVASRRRIVDRVAASPSRAFEMASHELVSSLGLVQGSVVGEGFSDKASARDGCTLLTKSGRDHGHLNHVSCQD
ncbi:hypothetical protein LX32DRAFT_265341 [Colletotrichum zoysiae]|uniref:Uncharacterized protein n=1 Tax=Colletotrichum zoysiae TaxID=1216348 RepID=A0AAD9H3P1_9PEZI|nr:hypothetical protein LX32DRAFT_265341 [Colletotrichum zoysiae]